MDSITLCRFSIFEPFLIQLVKYGNVEAVIALLANGARTDIQCSVTLEQARNIFF